MSQNVANLPYSNGQVRASITTLSKSPGESNSRSNAELYKEINIKNKKVGSFVESHYKMQPVINSGNNLEKNWRIIKGKRTKCLNKSVDLTHKMNSLTQRMESSSLYNKISLQESFRDPKSHICDIKKFLDTTMNVLNKRIEEKKQITERMCILKVRNSELQSLIINKTTQLQQNEKLLIKTKMNTKKLENDCDNIREAISLLTSKADEKTKVFEEYALKLKNEHDILFQEIEKFKEYLKNESQESLKEKSKLKQNIRKLEINHLEANNALDNTRKKQLEIKRENNEALEILMQKSMLISKMFNDSMTITNIKTVKQVTPNKIKSKRNYSITESSKTHYK